MDNKSISKINLSNKIEFITGRNLGDIDGKDRIIDTYLMTKDGSLYYYGYYDNLPLDSYWKERLNVNLNKGLINYSEKFKVHLEDRITSFKYGPDVCISLTKNRRLFIWGNSKFIPKYISKNNNNNSNNTYFDFEPHEITDFFMRDKDDFVIDFKIEISKIFVMTNKGKIYGWGSNEYNSFLCETKFVDVPLDFTHKFDLKPNEKIVSFDSDYQKLICFTNFNRVFIWGNFGATKRSIGLSGDNISSPIEISNDLILEDNEIIKSVKTSRTFSAILTSKGIIYSFGLNDCFQTGHKGIVDVSKPQKLNIFDSILGKDEYIDDLWLSELNTIAKTNYNNVFFWGYKGDFHKDKNSHKPTKINDYLENYKDIYNSEIYISGTNFISTNSGEIYAWGNNPFTKNRLLRPTLLCTMEDLNITNLNRVILTQNMSDSKLLFSQVFIKL